MHSVWGRVTLGEQMDTHPSEKYESRRDEVIEYRSPNVCYGPHATGNSAQVRAPGLRDKRRVLFVDDFTVTNDQFFQAPGFGRPIIA